MKKQMFALMLFAAMLFGSAALAEGVVLPDPGYYFGRVWDGYIIKFDEYPKAEFDAYTALLINEYGLEITDAYSGKYDEFFFMKMPGAKNTEVFVSCYQDSEGGLGMEFDFSKNITLSALDVYTPSAKCDICGGDAVCDTCGGKGYLEMTAYGSKDTVRVACTEGCLEGNCSACSTKNNDTTDAGNAESVLVSTPVEITTSEVTADSVVVQDLYSYMQNKMSFGKITKNKKGQSDRGFSGDKNVYDLICEYVESVTSGSYNLRLVDSYYNNFNHPHLGNMIHFSFALDYTGMGNVHGEKPEMYGKDGVYGDVVITGFLEYSSFDGHIYAADGLEFGDLGLRIDGETESVSLPGTSLYADLYRLSDGSYQTGDGRFHVKVGEAAVYRDGEMYTTDATLYRNQGDNREELRIYNFYRNESIALAVPYNSVMTGDILDRSVIGRNDDDNSTDKYMTAMEKFFSWKLGTALMGVCHDGDYFIFYRDDLNNFDDAVVRVMYWDEAADVAVFYICTTFDSAPYEYEAVAAVSLGGTPQGTNADEVFNMQAGKTLDITFSDTEFMPTHELFTWEILEGSSLIELTGARSQTCTIRAYDPGVVRLKVTYEYGAKGANILTGNEETKFMSKTREYVINISPK